MFKALQQLTGTLPKEAFKSFTSDRGKEFACYSDVEKSMKIDFYFADPYSAWQRVSIASRIDQPCLLLGQPVPRNRPLSA